MHTLFYFKVETYMIWYVSVYAKTEANAIKRVTKAILHDYPKRKFKFRISRCKKEDYDKKNYDQN